MAASAGSYAHRLAHSVLLRGLLGVDNSSVSEHARSRKARSNRRRQEDPHAGKDTAEGTPLEEHVAPSATSLRPAVDRDSGPHNSTS